MRDPAAIDPTITDRALALCAGEGFTLAGAATLAPSSRSRELRDWLDAGLHGEMTWLADTIADRADPARLLRGARSVVMVADAYWPRGSPPDEHTPGRIARYCRGRDYHATIKRRLRRVCDALRADRPGAGFRTFCDTAPVHERELAAICGLGWIGKHTLLIHPRIGSWLVLGGFLTTLALGQGGPSEPDRCGSCTRCIDACPTGAISPYRVDARACISYLTIEHESSIDRALADRLAPWLVGCDICQEVCPHNSPRAAGSPGLPPILGDYTPRRTGFDPLDVLAWDESTRRARFATSAMKRVSLVQMKRNALLVARAALRDARSDGTARVTLAARARDIVWDATEHEIVRAAARDLLGALGPD